MSTGIDLAGADASSRRSLGSRLLSRYRRAGADPPYADPGAYHATPFEGYYWRISDPARGRVIAVLCGVCRLQSRVWAVTALASHPGGDVHTEVAEPAAGDDRRLGVRAGRAVHGSARGLEVRLGSDVALDVELREPFAWPRGSLGGSGLAQLLPGLPQYWHPWLLGAGVEGEARIGGERISLDGAVAYAEKNWGRGFPRAWWWGQADAFEGEDLCVAFAGGPLGVAGLSHPATLIAARIGDRLLSISPPLARTTVSVGGDAWHVRARTPLHTVELDGEALGSFVTLPVPLDSRIGFDLRSCQALAGRLRIAVRRRGRTVVAAESRLAGLERPLGEDPCD